MASTDSTEQSSRPGTGTGHREPDPVFHRFLELNAEIRVLVWEECLPHRIVNDYRISLDPLKAHAQMQCDLMSLGEIQRRPAPSIARACRESRAIALKRGFYISGGKFLPPHGQLESKELNSWFDAQRDFIIACPWSTSCVAVRWHHCTPPPIQNVALDMCTDEEHLDCGVASLLDRNCPFLDKNRRTVIITETAVLPTRAHHRILGSNARGERGPIFLDMKHRPTLVELGAVVCDNAWRATHGSLNKPGIIDYFKTRDFCRQYYHDDHETRQIRLEVEENWLRRCERFHPPQIESLGSSVRIYDGSTDLKDGLPSNQSPFNDEVLYCYDRNHPWTQRWLESLVDFELKILVTFGDVQTDGDVQEDADWRYYQRVRRPGVHP